MGLRSEGHGGQIPGTPLLPSSLGGGPLSATAGGDSGVPRERRSVWGGRPSVVLRSGRHGERARGRRNSNQRCFLSRQHGRRQGDRLEVTPASQKCRAQAGGDPGASPGLTRGRARRWARGEEAASRQRCDTAKGAGPPARPGRVLFSFLPVSPLGQPCGSDGRQELLQARRRVIRRLFAC